MPNWCSNYMRIECDDHSCIDDFLARVIGKDGEIDFNQVISMPAILDIISSGATVIDGREVSLWIEDDDVERVLTPAEALEVEKAGFTHSSDWSIANWGTKWNARNTEIDKGELAWGSVELTYETPWTPPYAVLSRLKELFPKIDFEFRCRHEEDHPYPHQLLDADLVHLFQLVRRVVS